MLRDMALIVLFLGLFFFAILVFETMEEISALVSTFFVFISGVIPTLIFKRSSLADGIKLRLITKSRKQSKSTYYILRKFWNH